MLRNLGVAVRDNPLPLLLIGAGIGWLALGGGGTPRARHPTGLGLGGRAAATDDTARWMSARASDTAHRAADATRRVSEGASDTAHRVAAGASDAAHRVAEGVSGAARSVGEGVSGAARSVGEGVSGAARSVGEGVSGAARQVSEGISDAASAGAHYASDVGRGVGEYAGGAAEAVARLAREQPLVLGAIGFALGATVGALLPGTDTEDRLMGETRDAALERARASAEQGYERVKDTAREHLDRAREGEGAEKLSGVGSALTGAAHAAADAVKDAAHDLAGQAKGAMGAADEGARREENRPGVSARPTPDPRRPGPV
jgi:hypothetical protein